MFLFPSQLCENSSSPETRQIECSCYCQTFSSTQINENVKEFQSNSFMMEYVYSERRNQFYIYIYQKELANNIRSFQCELKRQEQCKSRIKVNLNDEIISFLNEHTHAPCGVKAEVAKVGKKSFTFLLTTFF